MKILQVLPYFPPHSGGLEQVAEKISKYFVKGNYGEIVNLVFSVGQSRSFAGQIKDLESWTYEKDGYKVIILPAFDLVYSFPFPKFWKKEFREGIKQARKFNPDIIQTHTRFFISSFLGGFLAKKWKKKWVHVEHGGGFVDDIAWWKKGIAWLYDQSLGRLVFRWADKIISINEANIAFITKFVSKKKVEVIYNGIEFPEVWGKILRSIPEIVFVWRLAPGKGGHILLEAIKKLKGQWQSDFHLSIIGDGDQRELLEAFVKEHKLGNVTFLWKKSHDEVIEFLAKKADILVNPSLREGLPTTVLEGLLAKCVVVATDVGGTKEISNKADLILVEAKDVDGLAEAIEGVLEKMNELRGLSYEGVKERFDWERSIRGYVDVYKKV